MNLSKEKMASLMCLVRDDVLQEMWFSWINKYSNYLTFARQFLHTFHYDVSDQLSEDCDVQD